MFNEAVSGDTYGNQLAPSAVGAFIAGLNTYLGHTSQSTDTAGGGSGDSLLVTLLPTQTIESVVLTITNFSGTGIATFAFVTTRPSTLQYEKHNNITSNQIITFTGFPLTGQPAVILSSQYQTFGATTADGWDWQWDVTVSETPEPSTVHLLGAGIGALGIWLRRRRG